MATRQTFGRPGYGGSGYGGNTPDAGDAMENLLEKSFEALNRADGEAERNGKEDTVKFGPIELPAGIASFFTGLWNEATDYVTGWLEPHSHELVSKLLNKTSFSDAAKNRTTALTSVGLSLGIKSAGFIKPIFKEWKRQHTERHDLARQIAPVLDDIKGNHSVSSLMSITAGVNEVIYAHRQRMALKAHTENLNNVLTLIINAAPNVAMDYSTFKNRWQGKSIPKFDKLDKSDATEKFQTRVEHFARIGTGPLAQYITHANTRKLEKKQKSSSALEMILALDQQVKDDHKATSFSLPGDKSSRDLSLEEYIAATLVQHQRDMADLSPDYTEIRKALQADLAAVVKPLADAIRDGDVSPLSLIRLVGEGKIIKKKGRVIADADSVAVLVKKVETKVQPQAPVDAKEYYADASFSKKDLTNALQSLEGKEKVVFASMFPDSILLQAGMSEADVKAMREATLKSYTTHLAEAVAGIAAKSDEQLKKEGLAQNEIKQLREAITGMSEQGVDGVKQLRSGPAHADGIERTLTNLAVARINGDKSYFGTLLSKGHEELATLSAKAESSKSAEAEAPAGDEAEAEVTEKPTHGARESARRTSAPEAAAER